MPEDLTEHASRNQKAWAGWAAEYVPNAERNWATDEIAWGILKVPERELQLLPDIAGKDVVELGCGTAYVSAWLARRGARPVGVDLSEEQLATARRMQAEHGIEFPLVHASAEDVPLSHASFDVVFCGHGAMTFADPYRTVPEVARLLRRDGLFAFSHSTPLALVCLDEEFETMATRLVRPYFGMHRFDDLADEPVEFNLPYGEWIRLFRENGFRIEALVEVRPAEGAESTYRTAKETEWARSWPMEEIWRCRKTV